MTANQGEPPTVVMWTRRTRWLVFSGVTCLVLAIGCFAATYLWMRSLLDQFAHSGTLKDLAEGFLRARIPTYVGWPLFFVGNVLLIVGLFSRESITVVMVRQRTRRLIFCGVTCLVLAFGGVAVMELYTVSSSTGVTGSSEIRDFTNTISHGFIPVFFGGPATLVGLSMIIGALLSRRFRSP